MTARQRHRNRTKTLQRARKHVTEALAIRASRLLNQAPRRRRHRRGARWLEMRRFWRRCVEAASWRVHYSREIAP